MKMAEVEEKEREIVINSLKKPLVKGEAWFIIAKDWFRLWRKFVNSAEHSRELAAAVKNPGPIDNASILTRDKMLLKCNLAAEMYCLIPEESWNYLLQKYGLADIQRPLQRHVVDLGYFKKRLQIEVYLLEFKLCCSSDMARVVKAYFSREDTWEDVRLKMCSLFRISNDEEVRLWTECASNEYLPLDNRNNTLLEECAYMGQVILIEPKQKDGTFEEWQQQTNGTYVLGKKIRTAKDEQWQQANSIAEVPDIRGLVNLGNTCWLNVTLQMISRITPISEFICSELDVTQEVQKAFSELMAEMLNGPKSIISPRTFKECIGKENLLFAGHSQMDCLESLLFLIDLVHEYAKKELSPSAKVNVEEIIGFQSVVTKSVYGTIQNTFNCNTCCGSSSKIDPFNCISLPIPELPGVTGRLEGRLDTDGTEKSEINLTDCLNLFFSEEVVEYSPCGVHKSSVKEMRLATPLPCHLLLQLKRFRHRGLALGSKIETAVHYPLSGLDLTPWIVPTIQMPKPYDLVEVIKHKGTLTEGHYVSLKKCGSGWFTADDSKVYRIAEDEAMTGDAYILLYKLRL